MFIDYCMELDGRNFRLQNLLKMAKDSESKIPKASAIVQKHLKDRVGQAELTPLSEAPARLFHSCLEKIVPFTDPFLLVPSLTSPVAIADTVADPLGIDAILKAQTAPAQDDRARLYQKGLHGAEVLAQLTTEMRVRLACACVLVAEVSELWIRGAPNDTLKEIAAGVDKRTDEILRLLVDIARATKGATVEPKGVQNGLLRAASQLKTLVEQSMELITQIAVASLPRPPNFESWPTRRSNPLQEAIQDGQPLNALPWMKSRPDPFEARVGACLLEGIGGASPQQLIPEFSSLLQETSLRTSEREWIFEILEICRGICALRTGEFDVAKASADVQFRSGLQRKNGIFIAQATLIKCEALFQQNKLEELTQYRLDMAKVCWALGCRGSLTLIARWTPPSS